MKNYLKSFSELFVINEMASTLSKLGVPKKLISVIHNLPDQIETMRPFTYSEGDSKSRKAEIEPIAQNRPTHAVGVIDSFRMKKTKLLGDNYRPSTRDKAAAKKAYDEEVAEKGEENVIKPTILAGSFHKGGKIPGYLADMQNFPLSDREKSGTTQSMRVLLAVPKPGGKYAGQPPRYDYIYEKGTAWGKRHQGGGKKYRILTMDEDGNIVRDWQAYQGKITYPKNPEDRNAPRKFRNDFSDFPHDADGMIDVYVLDTELSGETERSIQDLGARGKKVHWNVPIGKARKTGRARKKSKWQTADNFVNLFLNGIGENAKSHNDILTSIFGKRKEEARQKYAELIAGGADITTDEMNNLQSVIASNENVANNLYQYYNKFLKYLMANGKYEGSNLTEISDEDDRDISGLGSFEIKKFASITDVIDKHSQMSALRKFAEFILTGEIDDIYKDVEIEDVDTGTDDDEFEDFAAKYIDKEGLDLENPDWD